MIFFHSSKRRLIQISSTEKQVKKSPRGAMRYKNDKIKSIETWRKEDVLQRKGTI